MQGKKALFLFLALLLPVGIFVFLKMFGKNEFDVPPLYEQEPPVADVACNSVYTAPYAIPDTILQRLSTQVKGELYLIFFAENPGSRIREELKFDEVKIVNAKQAGVENETARKCVFMKPDTEDIVLVDRSGKIRGYYRSANREDVDRLMLEVEIILKKY